MSNMHEMSAYAKAIAGVVQTHVKNAFDAIKSDIDRRFAEIPSLEATAKAAAALVPAPEVHLPDIEGMVKTAIEGVEVKHGQPGKDGEPGADGKDAVLPDIAAMVKQAVDQIEVKHGENGKDAVLPDIQKMVDEAVAKIHVKDGAPGRDAPMIEILPVIDETRSYPRSTYAKHNGGLWRSYETTVGLKGWECVIEGIAQMSVEQDGERGFKAIATLSSGTTHERSISIPVAIYRGVFKHGESYEAGDMATWAGSVWHCSEPTTDKPGENGSKGWTLAVKKGRDASAPVSREASK